MSAVAKLIEDMIEAGVRPDLIGRAAALLAERDAVLVPDEQAERRRAKDRERKRLRNSAESAEFQAAPASLNDPQPELTNVQVSLNPPPPYSPPAARRFADWPEDFGALVWAAYPRKTEKKAGIEALQALHRRDRVAFAEIMAGIDGMADCDPQFVPALARWIKGERWKDERIRQKPPPHRQAPSRGTSYLDGLDQFEQLRSPNVQHFPRIAS